jgi:SAM-dependent methyltransferase
LNWAIRYAPILDVIERTAPALICDVGSGPRGVSEYVPGTMVIGTDLVFEGAMPPNLVAVVARAESLPFRTAAFDLTVCMDMLEHLAPGDRPAAVAEVARISREHAILAFPSGSGSERIDRWKRRLLRRWRFDEPPWLTEHLSAPYPPAEAMASSLPAEFRVTRIGRNDNLVVDLAVFAAEYRVPARLVARAERIDWIRRVSALLGLPPAYRRVIHAERR